MTEKATILYEDLPYEEAVKLLGDETLKRLNGCRTDFGFSGYNVKIPGFVTIPVKLSKVPEERKEQIKELQQLGYKKVDDKLVEQYKLGLSERQNYAISIEKLMSIHKKN